jgi:hypothetical protein
VYEHKKCQPGKGVEKAKGFFRDKMWKASHFQNLEEDAPQTYQLSSNKGTKNPVRVMKATTDIGHITRSIASTSPLTF